ncbi:hypothetical protein [Microbacterium rhizomatis]|uniref:Uncharacterized protein n=1 Tax=Microbacterium rhizomatis TaxID=1631477 RepID=A0A5J5J3E1_9MICO|nr:hypothetical protein [Microbacterium rhizomatis]KAA9107943.1 hypothetical protein F6B43_10990 [Microbacterium rhizomatis]
MEFIVKDLMISVLPQFDPRDASSCGACSADSSGPPCTGICPGSKDPFEGHYEGIRLEDNPRVLAALKQQLHAHIAAVEARESALYKQLAPSTPADVRALRAHLTAALDALDSGEITAG